MPGTFYVRFADFSAGHAGVIDSARILKSAWFGDNTQLYRTGLVGPRTGLKDMGVTGVGSPPAAGSPFGLTCLGQYLYVVTDKLYRVLLSDLPVAAASAFPAYPATPTGWVPIAPGDGGDVYSLENLGLYRHTPALTTAAVSTPTPMRLLARWRYWLVAASNSEPNRLYYSTFDPDTLTSTFTVWSATDFIPVGDTSPITALVPLYNTLFIAKRNGWWALTGEPGFTSYLREVLAGYGPTDGRLVSRTVENRAPMWLADVPSWFNGSTVRTDNQQSGAEFVPSGSAMVVATPSRQRTIFGYDDGETKALISDRAIYESHRFGARLAGFAPENPSAGTQAPADVVLATKRAAGGGETFKLYAWKHDTDRPGQLADTWSQPGDDSVMPLHATLLLPAWYDGNARRNKVRTVWVQYRSWGGHHERNMLKMRCIVHGRYMGGQDVGAWHTEQFDAEPIPTEGRDGSARFDIGEQGDGIGFQIELELVGLAVREVVTYVQLAEQ